MSNYAISNGSKIVNVVLADSKEVAEQATQMEAFETFGEPWIDWTLEPEGWRPPPPFPSWTWDDSAGNYEPPVPQPEEEAKAAAMASALAKLSALGLTDDEVAALTAR